MARGIPIPFVRVSGWDFHEINQLRVIFHRIQEVAPRPAHLLLNSLVMVVILRNQQQISRQRLAELVHDDQRLVLGNIDAHRAPFDAFPQDENQNHENDARANEILD
jgi:hypothetical protein